MVNTDPFRLSAPRDLERLPRLNESCDLAVLTMRGICLGSLADLLLEQRGATIAGYVLNPTRQGELTLPPLPPLLNEPAQSAAAPDAETTTDGENAAPSGEDTPAPGVFSTRARVIPASSRVRISESLILLVADTEPLREEEVVVVPQQPEERIEVSGS